MKVKYYAVKSGRTPGIYTSWDECKSMVHGYAGAVYKSFGTLSEAKLFMNKEDKDMEPGDTYAFVDGSYNASTGVYGYGGFLVHDGNKYKIQGSGSDTDMASMRNVAGEVLGSMAAVQMAVDMGITRLDIYYDYMGIEMWAKGEWKRNRNGTIAYYNYIQSVKDKITLRFIKVKGHSGVDGNEEADRLAKEAVGISV